MQRASSSYIIRTIQKQIQHIRNENLRKDRRHRKRHPNLPASQIEDAKVSWFRQMSVSSSHHHRPLFNPQIIRSAIMNTSCRKRKSIQYHCIRIIINSMRHRTMKMFKRRRLPNNHRCTFSRQSSRLYRLRFRICHESMPHGPAKRR